MAHLYKKEAIALLGGTLESAAKAVGVTKQAVSQWPDPLTSKIADRVLAALYRREVKIRRSNKVVKVGK